LINLDTETGVIVFNIVKGSLAKKGRLEIMLDDSLWPACSTQKATSTHAQWNYVGEGFVKELDFSRVWFRLNENDENEKDDIVGDFKLETVKFLQQALVRVIS
jgi:Ca2+-dependent lipid-binding protein